MLTLGIESSCDDTSVAIVEDDTTICSNVIASQHDYHRKYGGVVPEIAARKHLEHILPVIQLCLDEAGKAISEITAVGVTNRPGLIGSLLVGLTAAKSIAYVYDIPLIGINHIEAHAYASCFAGLPYGSHHIALIVSGGHTNILEMKEGNMKLLGSTVDDAAGEAFDKIAKVLNLEYPGGPAIDRLARHVPSATIKFPRPMMDQNNFNFSFSGLKTAVIYYLHQNPEIAPAEIAAAFQEAAVDVLITKTIKAAESLNIKTIAVAGGVACNSKLRKEFSRVCERKNMNLVIPEPVLCTDNAAMVAGLTYQKFIRNCTADFGLNAESNAGLKI